MSEPARSITELEHRDETSKRWRFGLAKLLVVSNLVGIVVAVVVITKGMAVAIGILVGFCLPMLVLIGIASVLLFEKLFGRKTRPIKTKARDSTMSPFDD